MELPDNSAGVAAAVVALGGVVNRLLIPWLSSLAQDHSDRRKRREATDASRLSRCERERASLARDVQELIPTCVLLAERLRVAQRDRHRCKECGRLLDES